MAKTMSKNLLHCDDCGTRNTPDSKYCKECGGKLQAAFQTVSMSAHDQVEDALLQERLTQFLDMAFWHTQAGNVDAAVRACNSALAIQPNSTTAHSLLGSLYEKKGDDVQAIGHFECVLALNPDSDADRAKLEQLRDGIHAPALPSAPLLRRTPSWLARLRETSLAEKFADMRRPDLTVLPARPTPALIAGALAVMVLACSLFMIKPAPPAAATSHPPSAVPSGGIAPSAFATASANENNPSVGSANPLPAPIVLLPSHPGTPLLPPGSEVHAFNTAPRTDPFVGSIASMRSEMPVGEVIRPSARTAHARPTGRATRGGLHSLPPLSLVAVTPAQEGPLPPAPVHVPASVQAAVSPYVGVARHTVVVQHFNGTPSEFSPSGARIAAATGGDNSAPPAPAHIEITIDRGSDSAGGAGGDNTPPGETYQQTAFALQQQGDYGRARATYEKAVHAYQSQIDAGRDPESARRGLEACQTGLQICRQSQ